MLLGKGNDDAVRHLPLQPIIFEEGNFIVGVLPHPELHGQALRALPPYPGVYNFLKFFELHYPEWFCRNFINLTENVLNEEHIKIYIKNKIFFLTLLHFTIIRCKLRPNKEHVLFYSYYIHIFMFSLNSLRPFNKNSHILFILSLLFLFPGLSTFANSVERDCVSSSKSVMAYNENQSYRIFELEVNSPGNYFISGWILPTCKHSQCFEGYDVFVNSQLVGRFQPEEPDWQSIPLLPFKDKQDSRIFLQKGLNVVAVSSKLPDVPQIETIQGSIICGEDALPCERYWAYRALAKGYDTTDFANQEESEFESDYYLNTNIDREIVGIKYFTRVPLNYTFYKAFVFRANEQVSIKSASHTEHNVDLVFLGTTRPAPPNPFNPNFSDSTGFNPTVTPMDSLPPIIVSYDSIQVGWQIGNKLVFPYTPCSNAQIQGLNWKSISEENATTHIQETRKIVDIPIAGIYQLRVRSKEDGAIGTATVMVNDSLTFEDVIINYTHRNCMVPADTVEYAFMTNCNAPGVDDPMLYIHGADADRVVGYNDDGKRNVLDQYELSSWDSYIKQSFLVKVTALSVGNFSSINPSSTCNILARVVDSGPNLSTRNNPLDANADYLPLIGSAETNEDVKIEILGTHIRICGTTEILGVSAYDTQGLKLSEVKCDEAFLEVDFSELNLSNPGIYLLRIGTPHEIYARKVIVR